MTTPSAPSLTLSNGTGQNSFDLRSTSQSFPVQTTLCVLSRYNAARVNPYTAFSRRSSVPQLSAHDEGIVKAVVNSLMVVGNLGDTLNFGFGIEDAIQSIVSSLDNAIQGNTIDHPLRLPTHRLIRIPPLILAH